MLNLRKIILIHTRLLFLSKSTSNKACIQLKPARSLPSYCPLSSNSELTFLLLSKEVRWLSIILHSEYQCSLQVLSAWVGDTQITFNLKRGSEKTHWISIFMISQQISANIRINLKIPHKDSLLHINYFRKGLMAWKVSLIYFNSYSS